MSSDYNGAFAVVIEEKDLERLQLKELALFYKALDDAGITIEDIAHDFSLEDYSMTNVFYGPHEEKRDSVVNAYSDLRDAFKAKTGLDLMLNNHNSYERGSDNDEVDGPFWSLSFGDVYKLTPEAKKLQQTVPFEIKRFVDFG